MRMAAVLVLGLGLTSLGMVPRAAIAAWPADPLVNVPVCTATGDQQWPASVSDGTGGVIVAWTDVRSGGDYSYSDIYVQRISATGVAQWAVDGVPLCTAPGSQSDVALGMISDGAGGAIVTWHDFRSGTNYHIYAQRISGAGAPLWTADGVVVCGAAGTQQSPKIVTDGSGGGIIGWVDFRNGNYDIYAQRISSAGVPAWGPDGVAVCTATGFQEDPALVADGSGGAIVCWTDQRSGPSYTDSDIYAQRLSSSGAPQWAANGVPLCTATGADQSPQLTGDGLGGAIVSWFDFRSGDYDIYAQRISSAGSTQWTADGVALCVAPGEQAAPAILPDGAGGAIVSWRDIRSGSDYDVYSQRISQAGATQWAANGVALCTSAGDQYEPTLVSDGSGGAIATWADYRSGFGDIYAQRISAAGAPQWTSDGVAVCTAPGNQNVPAIATDGSGGGIVAWHDHRGGVSDDIYAQRISSTGALGGGAAVGPSAPPAFGLERLSPNPARGGALRVRFSLPAGGDASLELLDVAGRRIASREVGSLGAGTHTLTMDGPRHLAPGLYMLRLRQGGRMQAERVTMLE